MWRVVMVSVVACAWSGAFGGESQFEQAQNKPGRVGLYESYEMPELASVYSDCAVKAVAWYPVPSGDAVTAVVVVARDRAAYIDTDEIGALIAGVKYLADNDDQIVKWSKTFTQARIMSRHGLKVQTTVVDPTRADVTILRSISVHDGRSASCDSHAALYADLVAARAKILQLQAGKR